MAYGSTEGNARTLPKSRIYQAPDATLFIVTDHTAIAAQAAKFAPFRVVTPSARIALKLSLIFWQNTPAPRGAIDPFLFVSSAPTLSWGLWLAQADRNTLGIYSPLTNLVGTIGPLNNAHTYQTIPVDGPSTGLAQQFLQGYTITVQDGQDAVMGVVQNQIVGLGVGAGSFGMNLALRARWEAVGTEICEDEWQDLRQKMVVNVPETVIYTS
jgi:hypothetical protein